MMKLPKVENADIHNAKNYWLLSQPSRLNPPSEQLALIFTSAINLSK